jgi:hypothetical protein
LLSISSSRFRILENFNEEARVLFLVRQWAIASRTSISLSKLRVAVSLVTSSALSCLILVLATAKSFYRVAIMLLLVLEGLVPLELALFLAFNMLLNCYRCQGSDQIRQWPCLSDM